MTSNQSANFLKTIQQLPNPMRQAAGASTSRRALLVMLTFLRSSGNAGNFQDYPYGVLSVATYCKSIANIQVLDLIIYGNNSDEYLQLLEKKLTAFVPDVVGFSVMFDNAYRYVDRAAQLVKKFSPQCVVVLGGAAITPAYKQILPSQKYIDAICYSEGEIPFFELLKSENMSNFLQSAPSWVTRESLQKGVTPVKTLVENLDDVIEIDYNFVDVKNYKVKSSFIPTLDETFEDKVQFPLVTSRGCPFKCTFCWHSGENDTSMRYASVDRVIDHISKLVSNFGLTTIAIYDDQILLNRKRAKELFRRLADFNLRIECPNGLTLTYIDDELASLMRKAGVWAARLAIESGDPHVLNKIINKPLRISKVKPVIDILKKYNFWIIGFFVVGMPGETAEHRLNTVNFIKDVRLDWSQISIASPSKGSILYDECIDKGYIEDQSEFVEYGFDENIISTPEFTADHIAKVAYEINLDVNFVNNNRMKSGDYITAISYFKYLTSTYPDHAFAHYYLAQALARADDRAQAEKHMLEVDRIIKEDSKWKEYFSSFGLTGGWPAPGFEDNAFGVLTEPKVAHREAEVCTRIQA
jgi:radical SAM superfamily enzyme YgiQ (UPF0313 family)